MSHAINKKCTSCTACVALCPTKSILLGDGQYVIDADTCEDCMLCVSVCPENAIHPVGPQKPPVPAE